MWKSPESYQESVRAAPAEYWEEPQGNSLLKYPGIIVIFTRRSREFEGPPLIRNRAVLRAYLDYTDTTTAVSFLVRQDSRAGQYSGQSHVDATRFDGAEWSR